MDTRCQEKESQNSFLRSVPTERPTRTFPRNNNGDKREAMLDNNVTQLSKPDPSKLCTESAVGVVIMCYC